MAMFSTSAGPIAYDSRGAGDPIVLLPSGGHARSDYDELRVILADRFTTFAIDWPGHDQSPPGRAPATELQLTHIVEEFLDSMTSTGAVLVGNSVGGNVAARLAIQRPDLVKGLVIIARRVSPLFSRSYMRARTDADHRARAAAIAITRTAPGLQAVTEIWHSFGAP